MWKRPLTSRAAPSATVSSPSGIATSWRPMTSARMVHNRSLLAPPPPTRTAPPAGRRDVSEPSSLPRDPLYGWILVAIVFTLSTLSFGALGAVSVFLKPLAAEFGWGRGETAFGYTAIAFSAALFGVLWGVIADRFGTRWFGIVAAVAAEAQKTQHF